MDWKVKGHYTYMGVMGFSWKLYRDMKRGGDKVGGLCQREQGRWFYFFEKKKEDKIVQDSKNVVYTLFKAC